MRSSKIFIVYNFKGIGPERLKERKVEIRDIEQIKQPNDDSCGIACVTSIVESINRSEDKQLRDLMENTEIRSIEHGLRGHNCGTRIS